MGASSIPGSFLSPLFYSWGNWGQEDQVTNSRSHNTALSLDSNLNSLGHATSHVLASLQEQRFWGAGKQNGHFEKTLIFTYSSYFVSTSYLQALCQTLITKSVCSRPLVRGALWKPEPPGLPATGQPGVTHAVIYTQCVIGSSGGSTSCHRDCRQVSLTTCLDSSLSTFQLLNQHSPWTVPTCPGNSPKYHQEPPLYIASLHRLTTRFYVFLPKLSTFYFLLSDCIS